MATTLLGPGPPPPPPELPPPPPPVLSAAAHDQLGRLVVRALERATPTATQSVREAVALVVEGAESAAQEHRARGGTPKPDRGQLNAAALALEDVADMVADIERSLKRLPALARTLAEQTPRFSHETCLADWKGKRRRWRASRFARRGILLALLAPNPRVVQNALSALSELGYAAEAGADDALLLAMQPRGRPKNSAATELASALARVWQEVGLSFERGADDTRGWPEFARVVFEAVGLKTWRPRAAEESRRRQASRRTKKNRG